MKSLRVELPKFDEKLRSIFTSISLKLPLRLIDRCSDEKSTVLVIALRNETLGVLQGISDK